MIRRYAFWTATVLAVLTAAPAWAADDVFHSIPTDALAFVAVNRIAEASAKIQKLARQVGARLSRCSKWPREVRRHQRG